MERQYVEMKKINWGMIGLAFILWILAIGCYIRMVQTIFMKAFELSILYMLITAVLILAGSVTFAKFDSETKKYYIKTERSRKNA
jgi:uncharacterized membrane protein